MLMNENTVSPREPESSNSDYGDRAELVLRLYISGKTPNSIRAAHNLERIRSRLVGVSCSIETVDLFEEPERAKSDGVLAVPTLMRISPTPAVRIIGDLSSMNRVLEELGFASTPGNEGQDRNADR